MIRIPRRELETDGSRQVVVHRLRQAIVGTLALLAVACSAAGPSPSATASATPNVTNAITPIPNVQPTLAAVAWWQTSGVSACGIPIVYRLDEGPRTDVGNCAAVLLKPAPEVTMRVGQEVDLHITTETSSGQPIYQPPRSSDSGVLAMIDSADKGATAEYRAIGTGTATLTTTGLCLDSRTLKESDGSCPVISVTVTD
jgi:hypothetical protein